ncbi:hypothetical protein EVAR_12363_1 [Eumeta japonica]|uniref:Uncharacterized protein n=1 Tax=Eumeta variegata TaxID=151549 RepID=A0A4C1X2X2_EUMVA|nr:hypothetical protein EVAR_12363_1 [Eumeta japonica]
MDIRNSRNHQCIAGLLGRNKRSNGGGRTDRGVRGVDRRKSHSQSDMRAEAANSLPYSRPASRYYSSSVHRRPGVAETKVPRSTNESDAGARGEERGGAPPAHLRSPRFDVLKSHLTLGILMWVLITDAVSRRASRDVIRSKLPNSIPGREGRTDVPTTGVGCRNHLNTSKNVFGLVRNLDACAD